MKIWNSFLKELKISSSGFYFYIEIASAVIFLLVLMLVVPEELNSKSKEVLFLDMPEAVSSALLEKDLSTGKIVKVEDTKFKLKSTTITYYDEDTGEKISKTYEDKKEIYVDTYNYIDSKTGKVTEINYVVDNFDDLLRITYKEKYIGSKMWIGEDGLDYYKVILFGSETERYKNLISVAITNVDLSELVQASSNQNVRYLEIPEMLNNRQQYLPIIIVIMNALLGMMIIVAYISLDKAEGLIKAYVVTPTSIYHYLMSKSLVVFIAVISTLIITVPVMKMQANYFVLISSLIIITYMSCAFGLLISSFFRDVKSSFGIVILVAILLMFPAIVFLIPSFSQTWIKFLPTYYMFEVIKESLMGTPDIPYILLADAGMLALAIIIFMISGIRYRKILSI